MNKDEWARDWAVRCGDCFRILGKPPYSSVGLSLIAILGLVLVFYAARLSLGMAEAKLPALADMKWGVEVYDRNGRYLCTLHHNGDRQPVPLSQMSKNIQNAVDAIA